MARYLLSAHCYVCIADEYAVFLDLRKDRYSALEPGEARALTGVVEGWITDDPERDVLQGAPTKSRDELIRTLIGERLVTDDEFAGKAAIPVSLSRAETTLERPPDQIPCVDRGHFAHFTAAWLTATAMLRIVPLWLTVERVRRRKARQSPERRTFDVNRVGHLMTAYSVLRPNFFSRMNACLRDSLTVVEFLARYDVFPTWVFGVRMEPFAAHSWVQEGTIVLNDTVKHVNTFIPIMAI